MAEGTVVGSSAQHTPPPRPPPPKLTSKTTEDLIVNKPSRPRIRKARSMHGKPRMDKVIQQRKMSLQDDDVKTSTSSDNSGKNHVKEVDHPVVASNRHSSGGTSSSSKSSSVERDSDHPTLPVNSDHQQVIENGDHSEVKTASDVAAIPPPPSTSPPVLQVSDVSNPTKSKRVRSVSVEDDMSVTKTFGTDKLPTRPRAKTLPRNLGHQHQNALETLKEGKSPRRPPPPPIPNRPPAVMQYSRRSGTPSSTSQTSLHSSCSSTPSIPEDSVSPPISPRVIPPSPDSEINLPQQTSDSNKPSKYLYPGGATNMEQASGGRHEHKNRSKGHKLFSTLKGTFRRHPKNPVDERRMTYSVESETEPVTVSHRRAKTVKEGVPTPEAKEELPGGVIPPIVVQCVAYLNRPIGLNEEGLFRIPGDMSQIRKLRAGFVSGKEMDLSEVLEPHNVAGLLKLHYRESKISLIPRGEISWEITRAAKARDVDSVHHYLTQIPSENLALIRVIVELLRQVSNNSDKNQMTSGNLGASCGPSIFPTLQAGNASALLKCLVDYVDNIFPE